MRRLLMLLCVLLMCLAACDTGGGDGNIAGQNTNNSPVQWDRSPATVVFRAEVRGGQAEGSFLSRNDIPPCTVYGNNRVVWTNDVGGGAAQVLYDEVSDERIIDFVNYLAINEQFYSYQAGADSALPSETSPVVETLTLFVNNDNRKTDALGGWSINYYERIVDSCRRISSEPVLFEPEGGWVSAELVPYDSSAPLIVWNSAAAGLSFGELAASGQPRWITGDMVRILWNTVRESAYNVRFDEGDNQYYVAVQVPGVTRDAPAAP